MSAYHTASLSRKMQAAAPPGVFIEVAIPKTADDPERTYAMYTRKKEKLLAKMTTRVMPGCCGVMLFYHFFGEPGEVRKLIAVGCVAAKTAGFGMVLYSLRSNSPAVPVAEATPLRFVFVNGKTNNELLLLGANLGQQIRPEPNTNVDGE